MEISPHFSGPSDLVTDVKKALEILTKYLSVRRDKCETHSVIVIHGFDDEKVLEATAIYLVSAISQNIEANLQIQEALFERENLSRELNRDVISVVGEHDVEERFKIMERNPWIWEGISHMFIHISQFNPDFHSIGQVLAKTNIKFDVHDHGLDLIAIYGSDVIGITAGECKAYFNNPKRAISDAANRLQEIDNNTRDMEIRSTVNLLSTSLDKDVKRRIAGSFWKNERSYLPFVSCDEKWACNWISKRKSLQQLNIPVSRKILIPLSLNEVRRKFDLICEFMRVYAAIEG